MSLSVPVIIVAFLFSAVVGVVFGVYPADKAAQIINTYTNLFEVPGVYKIHGH